jgi:hypothetical protein
MSVSGHENPLKHGDVTDILGACRSTSSWVHHRPADDDRRRPISVSCSTGPERGIRTAAPAAFGVAAADLTFSVVAAAAATVTAVLARSRAG